MLLHMKPYAKRTQMALVWMLRNNTQYDKKSAIFSLSFSLTCFQFNSGKQGFKSL